MYACGMQICYYNSVKYSIGIKFHVYHLGTILWGICFVFFILVMGRLFTNFVV